MARVLDSVTLPIKKNGTKTNQNYINNPKSIAPQFSASTAYTAGQYVFYDKKLYRFKVDHAAGAWNAAHAEERTVGAEISALKQDLQQLSETKADTTADNPEMGAGYAGQLVSSKKTSDNAPYVFRKTPVDSTLEYGDIVGASVAWNQLKVDRSATNDATDTRTQFDFTAQILSGTSQIAALCSVTNVQTGRLSLIASASASGDKIRFKHNGQALDILLGATSETNVVSGKKYFIHINVLGNNPTTVGGLSVTDMMCIDLTQMFGSTIADHVYTLEQATAGSGIAWLKSYGFFTKPYYAYDAGSIKSVGGLTGHVTRGFNQWDEEWETGYVDVNTGEPKPNNSQIRSKNFVSVLSETTYYFKSLSATYAVFYNADKQYISAATSSIANKLFATPSGARYMKFYCAGTTYNHDICINLTKPTGTPKNGDYVPYDAHTYPLDKTVTLRGLLKLSNGKMYADGDVWSSEGTVSRRYGVVDLGTLTWGDATSYFAATVTGMKTGSTWSTLEKDLNVVFSNRKYEYKEPTGWAAMPDKSYGFADAQLRIKDTSYSSVSDFKSSLSGVYLIYELATTITETAKPYGNPQVVNPDGTESYVYTDGGFELPVGHSSKYPVNVSAQLDDILDTPSTNGTYVLQATVSDGAVTYEWVDAT